MKFHIFSVNTSWSVLMNIQMSELMMSSPTQFSIHFIYRNDKNLIFQLWKYKTCLITTQSKWEIMFTLIYFDMGKCFYLQVFELKMKKIQNFIYNILWGDDIINSLIWIFIRTGQEMFSEKTIEISKLYIFLISHPIIHIFSLFCRKKWALSFKIDSKFWS